MTQAQNAAHPVRRATGRAQVRTSGLTSNYFENYSAPDVVEAALASWPTAMLGRLLGEFDTGSAYFFCPACQPPGQQFLRGPAAYAVGRYHWRCIGQCLTTRHRRVVADAVRDNDEAFERLLAALGVMA